MEGKKDIKVHTDKYNLSWKKVSQQNANAGGPHKRIREGQAPGLGGKGDFNVQDLMQKNAFKQQQNKSGFNDPRAR